MLFPTLGLSNLPVVVAHPDKRHANRAAFVLGVAWQTQSIVKHLAQTKKKKLKSKPVLKQKLIVKIAECWGLCPQTPATAPHDKLLATRLPPMNQQLKLHLHSCVVSLSHAHFWTKLNKSKWFRCKQCNNASTLRYSFHEVLAELWF